MREHALHALCPYFAMFPPEFARAAILRYTKATELVFDPFSGRGTTLLEAVLLGRRAIAADTNPVAFCVSAAKAKPPRLGTVLVALDALEAEYRDVARQMRRKSAHASPFFSWAYQRETLAQILFLRHRLQWRVRQLDRFIAALALGHLHGEGSPYYFSNRMPRTISTKPEYSVRYWRMHGLRPPERNVFSILRAKAAFRLQQDRTVGFARVRLADVREAADEFSAFLDNVSLIVTSPPYLDVTSFEEDQWLRLWFLGGEPRPTFGTYSRDDRHRSERLYWEFITSAWRGVAPLMRQRAAIACRIGSRRLSLRDLEERLTHTLCQVWPHAKIVETPVVSRLQGSRTTLLHPDAKGCRFEIDIAYRVA
jgi:DNA methylase